MMNPGDMMKLMGEFRRFQSDHPKAVAFAQKLATDGIPEGSVIEIRVDRPDGESLSCNLRVLPQDIEMLETLKTIRQ